MLWTPDDVRISYSELGIWVPERWDTRDGRVTLAGDAAHSMPPHRGQALNHCIQDVCNLVEAIKKVRDRDGGQAEGVQAYSDEVAERGAKETIMSKQSAWALTSIDRFTESAFFKHGTARMPEEK